jgi:aminopeptidase-like protein
LIKRENITVSILGSIVNNIRVGDEMYSLAEELFPICRSITGDGVRKSLEIIGSHVPIAVREVATGTKVFDWAVPKEWNIRDAYIVDSKGRKIVDFNESNLHVLNYSVPVNKKVSLNELKSHLYTVPEHPDWVPYRTSYYKANWGFCLSHNQMMRLRDEVYEVYIDSSLKEGHLTYGECVLRGESEEEVLLSAHICHPSLANDNLSGISLLTVLAKYLSATPRKYTYRFLYIPGTIGSITWLALNEHKVKHIKHGLVVSCVGDSGGPTYKRSRRGTAVIDKAVEHVLGTESQDYVINGFSPYGYDERQFCSPGFNLAVGLFERSKYGEFPEYHTSADNMEFIKPEYLAKSIISIAKILDILEGDAVYVNRIPKCEPQLGKRGLYSAIGADKDSAKRQMAMLWILNQSDGGHTLLDIAERAGIEFASIREAASVLVEHKILEEIRKERIEV